MTREEQIALLKKSVEEWNKWRAQNPNIKIDFSDVDLSGVILWRVNLCRAILSSADLSSADLSGANLREADLIGVNLSGADLFTADLRGANLRGADLSGADLSGAILFGTYLRGVKNLDLAINVPQEILNRYGNPRIRPNSEIDLEKIQAELAAAKKNLEKNQNQSAEEKAEAERRINELVESETQLQQKVDDLERKQKKAQTDIKQAIKLFDKPNEYIKTEINIANALFCLFLLLAIGSAAYFILFFAVNLHDKYEILKNNANIYLFLTSISPLVLAFSFALAFFKMANKKREEIKLLNEQKRKIETIKASLLAYNIAANPEAVQLKLQEAILQLQEDAFKIKGLTAATKSSEKEELTNFEIVEKVKGLFS